jgi:Tfp pilus assembly protein PilO
VKVPKINFRLRFPRYGRRSFVTLLLIAAAGYIAYAFLAVPVIEAQKKARDQLAMNRKLYGRYQEVLKDRKEVETQLAQAAQQVEAVHGRLLPGETPQIIAANLQEILKKLSERNGIQIKSFRIGEPKEAGPYVRIPVIIDINPTKTIAALGMFLYEIETYEKVLVVTDLDVTAPNMRTPAEVQGSMTVVGFARNLAPKGKGKEG